MAMTKAPRSDNANPRVPLLKKLFWLYFLLLIFEGALRKWLLPQYSAQLLLVRDPVALLIIWEAYRTRRWPKQWSVVVGALAAGILVLCFIQLIVGENPWFVALYGVRSYLLPFPVAFIMGENIDREDLRRFGLCTLWLLFPLTALEVAQYNASPDSILNTGASLGTEQLGYAAGHVRASATFSYVMGPTFYLPLAAAFIFYGMADGKFANKWFLYAASSALLVSIPVTGSRALALLLLGVLACVALAALFGVSQLASSLKAVLALIVIGAVVSQLPIVSDSTRTFEERIANASSTEGDAESSLNLRVIYPIVRATEDSLSAEHWYGVGMGLGSNAISTLLTGKQQFLAGEEEFIRILIEFGPPFGLAFMFFRSALVVMIAVRAIARAREHQPLALFMVPSLLAVLVLSVLEQPTVQGFAVVTLAFSLAALKRTDSTTGEAFPIPYLQPAPRRRKARAL
jgi:hypothetical protein